MAMNAALRVDAQVVLRKSDEMAKIGKGLENAISQNQNQLKTLTMTWESDAAREFYNKYSTMSTDINELLNIAAEYAQDLRDVANNYIATEKQVLDKASGLPTNVFGA